jgi:GNAT superfamily N-acetyltransferase
MRGVHVRSYRQRRVGKIGGVEVHRPPLDIETISKVPESELLITKQSLRDYEQRLRVDIEAIGLEEQYVFVARDSSGGVRGILVGFYLGDGAYENYDFGEHDVLREVMSDHAYIDALEVYDKRKGVGRQLVSAFEQWAREQGAVGIAGSPINERARQFNSAIRMRPHSFDLALWTKEWS